MVAQPYTLIQPPLTTQAQEASPALPSKGKGITPLHPLGAASLQWLQDLQQQQQQQQPHSPQPPQLPSSGHSSGKQLSAQPVPAPHALNSASNLNASSSGKPRHVQPTNLHECLQPLGMGHYAKVCAGQGGPLTS